MTELRISTAVRRTTASTTVPAALAATVGLAVIGWTVVAAHMTGMDMGVATELGSFGSFAGLWLAMTVAMMLPSAAPAIMHRARAGTPSVLLFVVTYLAVWQLAGVVGYIAYRPHGTFAAGVAVVVAGLYEFSPVKRRCRELCRQRVGSGLAYGLCCLGSGAGLMLILMALAPMSLGWMIVISVVMLAQKLLPAWPTVDASLALVIVAYGALVIASPGSVPGLIS